MNKIVDKIKSRDQIPLLLNSLELNGIGAEIGVFKGEYARLLIERWHCSKLILVDSWCHLANYLDSWNVDDHQALENYKLCVDLQSDHPDRVTLMRMSSRDAAALIDNDSLDFVYIDANHSFSSTSEDLDLWFPKLKIGGIFSGHDYFDALADDEFEPILHGSKELDVNELTSYGVKSAVDRFVNINNYEITVTNEEWPTWYFIK